MKFPNNLFFNIFPLQSYQLWGVISCFFCILVFIWCFQLVPHLIWQLMRYSWALNLVMAEQLVSRLDTSWLYWPAHSSLQGLVDCSQVRERNDCFLRRFLSLLLNVNILIFCLYSEGLIAGICPIFQRLSDKELFEDSSYWEVWAKRVCACHILHVHLQ